MLRAWLSSCMVERPGGIINYICPVGLDFPNLPIHAWFVGRVPEGRLI